ncbi:MAG: hypothetical protein AAGM21_04375 [Pseudomonadota bacterium]
MPVRPGADLQQGPQTQATPTATSGTKGDDRSAVKADTAQIVDPARQSADTRALPQNERNEEARLVEPSRLASETLAQQAVTPDAATPAGPPPTFDWSVLEKARALAADGPAPDPKPTPEPVPEPALEPQTTSAPEGDTQTPGRPLPEASRPTPPEARPDPEAAQPGSAQAPLPGSQTAPATASEPGQTGSVPPGVEA